MNSLFYSQFSYKLERNIVSYLPQVESKEKRTRKKLSKSNHVIMSLFTFFDFFVAWKFGRTLGCKYASLALVVYV